ncbi:MAG: rRNA methyltransferase [Micrococcales bacterium]|nr:rRNA methyltransferase [Micrococcales bacterium]
MPSDASGPGAEPNFDQCVGVGPWPGPLPDDRRYDPDLLVDGDKRNVIDRYRYWSNQAIVADLDSRRHDFHVGIENWEHDFNIGAIVRTANAFNASAIHIIGRRRWNRRGAMVTDRYLNVIHHTDAQAFGQWADEAGIGVIGLDNLPGAEPLERAKLPQRCVLLFGQEGPGLSQAALAQCERLLEISQYGSTRSLNAGAAAAIAMYHWALQHAFK